MHARASDPAHNIPTPPSVPPIFTYADINNEITTVKFTSAGAPAVRSPSITNEETVKPRLTKEQEKETRIQTRAPLHSTRSMHRRARAHASGKEERERERERERAREREREREGGREREGEREGGRQERASTGERSTTRSYLQHGDKRPRDTTNRGGPVARRAKRK